MRIAKNPQWLARLGILLTLGGALLGLWRWGGEAAASALPLLDLRSVQSVLAYLADFGLWSPLILFGLMVLQAVIPPIPTTPIATANGMLFGVWPGMLLSWAGSLTGASLSYWIAKRWGTCILQRFLGPDLIKLLVRVQGRSAFGVVLLARVTPVISLDAIGYWAGLSRMRFTTYLAATALGQAPHMLAYAILGNDLAQARLVSWRLGIILLAGILLYFLGRLIFNRLAVESQPAQEL